MLLLAIIAEILGTSTIKLLCTTYPIKGYSFLFLAIGLSYYFLSKAIVRIPLGLAYALWEGLGIAIITCIGYMFFKETLCTKKIIGIISIIFGICMLKSGIVTNNNLEKTHTLEKEEF